ncbi:MAG: type IV pilus biogenesis/stability protein PilW [Leptothrix sp. (in: b-proteobacteria)]
MARTVNWRLAWLWLPLVLAIGAEQLAVAMVLDGGSARAPFIGFVIAHGLASFLLVWVFQPLLPPRYQRPPVAVFTLCFSLLFFMPLIGAVALGLFALLMRWLPTPALSSPFRLARTPEFVITAPRKGRRLRELSVRQLLFDTHLAPALRSPALNALSAMPVRVVGEMLQRLLIDPVEDMRLVAYGLLDRREKELRQRLDEQGAALARCGPATPPLLHALHLRAMVELHFELVYQRLVQGDLRLHALAEALHFADEAIVHGGEQPGLLQLRARVHLEGGHFERARIDLQRAVERGAPLARVLPYLAEIAYLRRDWPEVRATMAQLQPRLLPSRLATLARYWHPGDAT